MQRQYTLCPKKIIFQQIILYLILCCCILLTACHERQKKSPPLIPVDSITVSTALIPLTKTYIGMTQSISEVGIRARVKGFLVTKNFIEGKPVKKGQLLFGIDPRSYVAKLELEKGNLAKSEADLAFRLVEFERMKILVKKGDISQTEHDRSEARYKAALADVEIAKAKVSEAEIELSYCSMYAPFDGLIGERLVSVGNLVGGTEDTLLANVVMLEPIYVVFNPSVEEYTSMLTFEKNMPFQVKVTLPHQEKLVFHGKMDLINNEAEDTTSTILMRAVVENTKLRLLPGVYVNIEVQLADKYPAILIPTKAIMEFQEQRSVYVVNQQHQVENRTIVVSGQYHDQSIIASGLSPGDIVVVDGLQKLKPGFLVEPRTKQGAHG